MDVFENELSPRDKNPIKIYFRGSFKLGHFLAIK
jgi:hypothetical protein